jgi:diguanylate cyclase (GGDEF)-like protein
MNAIDADDLPVGLIRIDADGIVVQSNAAFRVWSDCATPEGRPLSDFLVPVEDFLDTGSSSGMMARPDRPDRAAFMIAADDQVSFTIVDASERYASGRALRAARALADRTQRRLQLIIDSSIAFAKPTTEAGLAEILATTAAEAYRAEEATVYLADDKRQLWRAAGSNSFEELSDLGAAAESVLGLRDVIKVSGEDEGGALSPRLVEMMRATGVQSLIAAPLRLDDNVLGVFFCFFHHPRQFDDEATPLAEALAGQAAQALTSLRLQQRLEYAAMHDETTGLPNRRRLEGGIAALDQGENLAVLFIDLDGFKSVNDYLGHQQGDDVLREAARRLRSTVREEDVVIRYGGDEFVVVYEVRNDTPVRDLADRIRDALQSPYPGIPAALSISASIGVATSLFERDFGSIDRIIRMADQAMYEAKVGGGNQVVGA